MSEESTDGTEQTLTICYLTNHKVPIADLDPDADDGELVEQARKAAESKGQIQREACAVEDLAQYIRKEIEKSSTDTEQEADDE
jgi:hypothetical protein